MKHALADNFPESKVMFLDVLSVQQSKFQRFSVDKDSKQTLSVQKRL